MDDLDSSKNVSVQKFWSLLLVTCDGIECNSIRLNNSMLLVGRIQNRNINFCKRILCTVSCFNIATTNVLLRRAIITRYYIVYAKEKKIQETYFQESVLHNRLTQ